MFQFACTPTNYASAKQQLCIEELVARKKIGGSSALRGLAH